MKKVLAYLKNFFSKENFVPSTFDKAQKRQSLVVAIGLIISFIFSAFTFFNMFYSFSESMGSIVSGSPDVAISDLLRVLPLYLSFFMSLWTVFLFQAFYRNVSEEKRIRSVMKNAITILCFAGINIIYILVMRIMGRYVSLVEGSPSCIFPLDAILYSLLFVAIGVLAILYAKKYKDKVAYTVPTRPIVTKCRFIYCLGLSLWTVVACFGFTAGLLTIFIYDFGHGYAFFGILTIFVYLLSPVQLGLWEFYYHEIKEEKKKEMLLPISIASFIWTVLVVVLFLVASASNKDIQSNAGMGVFPLTFTATANYGNFIILLTPMIVSITALVKGIIAKVKAKKAQK